jgi:LmbE family N-acetylglucosaminyl deacetylase
MFEDTKRLIVVAAHPDDIEISCGGTLAILARRGVEIVAINCTCGDIGTHEPELTRDSLCGTRQEEAQAALALLGVRELKTLGHPDGELLPSLELRADLVYVFRKFQPDTLLTFDPWWRGQAHPDHTAAGRAALDAYMPSKMPLYKPDQIEQGVECADIQHVYFFDGEEPGGFVDISDTFELKVRAVERHVSQFRGHQVREWLERWNRETGRRYGVRYAEAFREMQVW